MPSRILTTFVLLLVSTLFAQKEEGNILIERFIDNTKINEAVKETLADIKNYYLNTETPSLDEEIKKNSHYLRAKNTFFFILHEIARADIHCSHEKYSQSLEVIEPLKKNKILQNTLPLKIALHAVEADIFYQLTEYNKALKKHTQILMWSRNIGDSIQTVASIIMIAKNSIALGNLTIANALLKKCEPHLLNTSSKNQVDYIISRSLLCFLENDYITPKTILQEQLNNPIFDDNERLKLLYILAMSFQAEGNYDKAIAIFKEGLSLSTTKRSKILPITYLKDTYRLQNNFEQAVFYDQKLDSLTESYNANIKESLLFIENEKIKAFRENLRLEKEYVEQELSYSKSENIFLAVISLLLLFLLIFSYLVLKKEKSLNLNLVRVNAELSKKNELIQQLDKKTKKQYPNEIIPKVEEVLISNKKFLDAELTLNILAKEIKSNTSHLSQAINDYYEKPFRTLINELRIREAISLFGNDKYAPYSIEGIANTVGYTSISAFNVNFKKITGVTPSFFRKHNIS